MKKILITGGAGHPRVPPVHRSQPRQDQGRERAPREPEHRRALDAHAAIDFHRTITNPGAEPDEADLRDLLANLMHYAKEFKLDFERELKMATDSYRAEQAETQSAAEDQQEKDRERKIADLAYELFHEDGDLEFDDTAQVSEGEDNGAYVSCWKWVSFDGTEFEKKDEEDL